MIEVATFESSGLEKFVGGSLCVSAALFCKSEWSKRPPAQNVFLSRRRNRRFRPLITKDFDRPAETPFLAGVNSGSSERAGGSHPNRRGPDAVLAVPMHPAEVGSIPRRVYRGI